MDARVSECPTCPPNVERCAHFGGSVIHLWNHREGYAGVCGPGGEALEGLHTTDTKFPNFPSAEAEFFRREEELLGVVR